MNHDPSKTKETVSIVNSRQGTAGSYETCQSAPVHPEKAACFTTIAEADSSVKTSPYKSEAFSGNKDPSQPCVVTTTHEKEDERAVSSSKFDSCPVSSLDTMQSVSILASLEYIAAPYDTLDDQQGGARKDEDASNKDINEVSTKISGAGKEKEPVTVCQEQHTNDYQQSSQTVNKKLPSEIIMGSVDDHETQSLGFEGLDSLFDKRSLSKPVASSQKALETGKETVSPTNKGLSHQDVLVKTTESDLYERVKQRQRRRPSEMSLQSDRRSDSPKMKSVQLKTKTRKRSVDAVAVATGIESIHDGNARKKLKNSEGPALQQDSPLTVNAESSQDESGVSTVCKEESDVLVNGSRISCVKGNGNGQVSAFSLGSHSCSSDNTVLSNEMVPASVSSSEKSIPSVINPMIAHVGQALEDAQRGSLENTDEWGSQTIRQHDHGEMTKNHTFSDNALHKVTTTEQSPQIKPIQVERKRMNHKSKDSDKAYQGQQSYAELTNSQISSPIQQLFSMALLVDGSEENGIPSVEEEKSAQVDVTERGGSSQVFMTGPQECLPLEPSENALLTCCDHQRPSFHEDVELTIESGSNDIHNLQNACSSSEPVPKQTQLTSSFNRHSQEEVLSEETRKSGSEIDGKLSHETSEPGGETSGPLSVQADPLDNTPTQSSLDVMDAVTPCLFENESWETPNRKTSQKKSGNKRGPKITSDISGSNSKIASRSSQTLGLSSKTVTGEDQIVATAGFEEINSLDGSPAIARNAEQQQFSSGTCCSDGTIKELTSDTDAEGTQSYGTSQSISVLHDLEFPLPDPQEDADNACSEQRDDRGNFSQNVHAESKGDAPWAEPLPKKLRSREPLSTSRSLNPVNVTLDQGIGPSIEMTRDSEYTESDVIPPTPPVKPVAKQVFSSLSPMKLPCPKMKPQRKDGAERLVVKQKKLLKSTRVSNAEKSQDSEGNIAGTRCNATCSEDSVSLLTKNQRTPKAPNAHTTDANQILEPDASKQLQSSPGKNGNKLENSLYESPTDLKHCVQSMSKEQKQNGVSSENINDLSSLQDKDDSQVSQKEMQRVLAEAKKRTDSMERLLSEIQEESVISSPRSSVKRRVYDIADSFDWSGSKDEGEGNRDSQDGSVILIVDDNKDTERVKENEKKDGVLTDGFPESVAGKFQQNDDRDRILVDVQDGDFRDIGHDSSSPCTYDGGESSSDEALLKPVFLPKEFKSGTSATIYEEDAENEEEQEKAFSQELIPSENEDDDDEDGIICE